MELGLVVRLSYACTGLAAWITDRLYEAGWDDPSSFTEATIPVAQLGETLAITLVSGLAGSIGIGILTKLAWVNLRASGRTSQAFGGLSEQAAKAVQVIDLRTAAEFRAGKRSSGPELEEQAMSQPESTFSSAQEDQTASSAESAESRAGRAEASGSGGSGSNGPSGIAKRMQPEVKKRMQQEIGSRLKVHRACFFHTCVPCMNLLSNLWAQRPSLQCLHWPSTQCQASLKQCSYGALRA